MLFCNIRPILECVEMGCTLVRFPFLDGVLALVTLTQKVNRARLCAVYATLCCQHLQLYV